MTDDRDLPDADWRLLDRYLAGECRGEELTKARERWGNAAPDSLRAALESSRPIDAERTARAWSVVREQMRVSAAPPAAPWWRSNVARIAAAVILLAGVATAVRVSTRPTSPGSRSVAIFDASTGTGERRTVVLPDGSTVTLAPMSWIQYFEPRPGSRDVRLSGQAFFSVTHDERRPFTVRAGLGMTRVLGTEFSVRAHENGSTEVVVASGRVHLRGSGDSTAVLASGGWQMGRSTDSTGAILTAGTRGMLPGAGGQVQVSAVDPREALAWRTGQIHFADAPLSEVVHELSRWFYEPIVVDSVLGRRRITADLRVDGPGALARTLDALSIAIDARWERRANTVVLRAR